MSLQDGVTDLHTHTTASDGTCNVDARIDQAVERGLRAVAITDHDRISTELDTQYRNEQGVELITGVEVRAGVMGIKIEILGYYVDPSDGTLQELLEEVRGYREQRNRQIIDKLNDIPDINTSYSELSDAVEGSLGRPHMANLLVDENVVNSVGVAFERYLGRGGEAYVEMEKASCARVIDAIHAAGGVASLAHPGRIRLNTAKIPELVDRLIGSGLDGIEVWYPYEIGSDEGYADIDPGHALELAEENDLIPTGGSDCHGPNSGKFRIGKVRAPATTVRELRAAAAV